MDAQRSLKFCLYIQFSILKVKRKKGGKTNQSISPGVIVMKMQ